MEVGGGGWGAGEGVKLDKIERKLDGVEYSILPVCLNCLCLRLNEEMASYQQGRSNAVR